MTKRLELSDHTLRCAWSYTQCHGSQDIFLVNGRVYPNVDSLEREGR